MFYSLAFLNYCLRFDFLIGDIYINYGTPLLEFETGNACLAEKAAHLLMQKDVRMGGSFVYLEGDTCGKVEVGIKKDQQESSIACTSRESDLQSLEDIEKDLKLSMLGFLAE